MRDINYKVMSVRLSDEVIKELQNRRQKFKSWNLMYRNLLGFKKEFKFKQKKFN